MCLYDKKRFRIALKPIKVWKIIYQDEEKIVSPIMKCRLKKINLTFLGFPHFCKDIQFYVFKTGFYHAFLSEKYAYDFIEYRKKDEDAKLLKSQNIKIVTGYIPPFVRYGYDPLGEICSRILILNL